MSSAKVFHTKAHERKKNEKYYTPAWATRIVLPHLPTTRCKVWWEPAAGDGGIMRVLEQANDYTVYASDIAPDSPHIATLNFLTTSQAPPGTRLIVTNPPFGTGGRLAFQFCWHALRLMEPVSGAVAMLLRDDFDSAGGRRALFALHPAFHKKVVINTRIRWTNLPQDPDKGPSGSHAWFIWDWARHAGPPSLFYAEADEDPLEAAR